MVVTTGRGPVRGARGGPFRRGQLCVPFGEALDHHPPVGHLDGVEEHLAVEDRAPGQRDVDALGDEPGPRVRRQPVDPQVFDDEAAARRCARRAGRCASAARASSIPSRSARALSAGPRSIVTIDTSAAAITNRDDDDDQRGRAGRARRTRSCLLHDHERPCRRRPIDLRRRAPRGRARRGPRAARFPSSSLRRPPVPAAA